MIISIVNCETQYIFTVICDQPPPLHPLYIVFAILQICIHHLLNFFIHSNRWKGTGGFINTKFWCRLCSMAHEADITRMHTYHRHTWWDRTRTCLPHVKDGTWASWKNVTRKVQLEKAVVC